LGNIAQTVAQIAAPHTTGGSWTGWPPTSWLGRAPTTTRDGGCAGHLSATEQQTLTSRHRSGASNQAAAASLQAAPPLRADEHQRDDQQQPADQQRTHEPTSASSHSARIPRRCAQRHVHIPQAALQGVAGPAEGPRTAIRCQSSSSCSRRRRIRTGRRRFTTAETSSSQPGCTDASNDGGRSAWRPDRSTISVSSTHSSSPRLGEPVPVPARSDQRTARRVPYAGVELGGGVGVPVPRARARSPPIPHLRSQRRTHMTPVTTEVSGNAPVGSNGAPNRALTSVLLPRLASPATSTRACPSCARAIASASAAQLIDAHVPPGPIDRRPREGRRSTTRVTASRAIPHSRIASGTPSESAKKCPTVQGR
jgi:hypothetical protein